MNEKFGKMNSENLVQMMATCYIAGGFEHFMP